MGDISLRTGRDSIDRYADSVPGDVADHLQGSSMVFHSDLLLRLMPLDLGCCSCGHLVVDSAVRPSNQLRAQSGCLDLVEQRLNGYGVTIFRSLVCDLTVPV